MSAERIEWVVSCHPILAELSGPVVWVGQNREDADAYARVALRMLERRRLDVRVSVLISRESGPRQPASESDPMYVAGVWNPATERLEYEGGDPLTL